MRILVLGAAGFIGRAIVVELLGNGHEVVAAVRPGTGNRTLAGVQHLEIDLATATTDQIWREVLQGFDIVVNAAGLLRGRDMHSVHVTMPRALCSAALAAEVKRVVLLSAISARADVSTDYAQTKLLGEAELRKSGIAWTILRPSLVYGEGSYGGTSLLRGLAALPGWVPLPGNGDQEFSPIHVRDLARSVRLACEDPRLAGRVLEPCGPETMPVRELLRRYRQWLGFGRTRFVSIPMPVMRMLGRIGDLAGAGPVSTNSLVQLVAGNGGNGTAFAAEIGFAPRSLEQSLGNCPAQVQDRWHARLFFLAPALRWALALLWLVSALLGFSYGAEQARSVTAGLGWPIWLADPLRLGGSLADLAICLLVLVDSRARIATPVQLLAIGSYTAVIGFAEPQLWLDPLGPLLKNLPILIAVLVHGAIADRH